MKNMNSSMSYDGLSEQDNIPMKFLMSPSKHFLEEIFSGKFS